MYVAALRSVGVPARLNAQGEAELLLNGKWQSAPRPLVGPVAAAGATSQQQRNERGSGAVDDSPGRVEALKR